MLELWQRLRAARERLAGGMDSLLDWYRPQLERLHDDAAAARPDLAQLRRIAATYATRERFLTELTLDPPAATSDESGAPLLDEDYLILSTIHSAKGQEWKVVQVLNCVDGCIPSDMATGTRGGDRGGAPPALRRDDAREGPSRTCCLPQRFYVRQQSGGGDRHVYAARSRFLTDAVCAHLDPQSWPAAAGAPERMAREAGVKVDLAARVRAGW